MSDLPIDQQANRFLENNKTQTPIPNERTDDNNPETKELQYFVFLIVVFAVAYWLFKEYYFV